jgi:UDP-N-acetylmuramoyl-L-alanyl-D-glutamate--2,6-diaminopimelate ligase
MKKALKTIKKILGKRVTNLIRPAGHGAKAILATVFFGYPASKLKIIGITGTKGKTTTSVMTGRLANLMGIKTGYISTAVICTGDKFGEILNPFKMTSIDSWETHRYLSQMVKNGCEWVVLEMSSQGLEQNRHVGLGGFDVTTFLNIYPEHIEAHGSYENYKKAKQIMFSKLKKGGIFVGPDDILETHEMWQAVPLQIQRGANKLLINPDEYSISPVSGTIFKNLDFEGKKYITQFGADFDISNLFVASKIVSTLGNLQMADVLKKLKEIETIPGRMDWAVKGGKVDDETKVKPENANISVLVDYAHEPASMTKLLETLQNWKKMGFADQIIHIVSCDGAGRDDWKKPILGQISFDGADISILTTDNFDQNDNPQEIVDLLSQTLEKSKENSKYFKITNRKQAFEKALEIAQKSTRKTVIVSTGVGSEQGLTQPEGKIEWDEKLVWQSLFV